VKKRYWPILALIPILLYAGFYLYVALKPTSLEGWIKSIQNPGFTLLYSSESDRRYVAIFDTGQNELAICDKEIGGENERSGSTSILSESGKEVWDKKRKFRILQSDAFWLGPVRYTPKPHGTALPVLADVSGTIRIQKKVGYEDDHSSELEPRARHLVIDVVIHWHDEKK
jgi:hypothetical protein